MISTPPDEFSGVPAIASGVGNLDSLLGGGLPANTLNILAGEPGTGKTILAQQVMFHHVSANPDARVLYLTTLSEPAMKVIRYLQGFSFYDPGLFGSRVVYRDIGAFLREQPSGALLEEIMRLVEDTQPAMLCIDSFKAIRDLMPAPEEFRRFCYDLSVRLASAACTTILIGEYETHETAEGAEFAVADGIIHLRKQIINGDPQRTVRVLKMRGQPMNMGEFTFNISAAGIHIFTPRLAREKLDRLPRQSEDRVKMGVEGLDALLLGGLSRGRSIMISGVSGSGKTTLGLQFLIEGAEQGERGILYSFEENPERLTVLAAAFGWDLKKHVDSGLLRVHYVPMTDVQIDEQLEKIVHEGRDFVPKRVVIDTLSAFFYKVDTPLVQRDKIFEVSSLIQKLGATGLFLTDVPSHEAGRVSRFGVEETVVDGTIVLSTELRAGKRLRHIEIVKMRTTDHVRGRHRMDIAESGMRVYYKSARSREGIAAPAPLMFSPLEGIMDGEVVYEHSWLVRGGPGAGKSVWAIQYAVERLRSGESVLFISTEASVATVLSAMERLGLLTEPYLESGQLVVKSIENSPQLDLEDPDGFITTISRWVDLMPKPCARIVDSLSPLLIGMSAEEFKAMLNKRKSLVARPDVSLFDTVMASEDSLQPFLTNHFDVVIDLYTPDWGDLRGADDRGRPVMRIVKARGVRVDGRPFPFRVSKEGGVVVQKEFYGGGG